MRKAIVAMALALASIARVDGQDAPATTSTTAPAPPLVQTTEVTGTLPELEGRWLLLATVGIGTSAKRTLPSVFDISRVDGKLEVRERHIALPPAQTEALRRGNEELGGLWAPTPADLETIAGAWEALAPEDRGIAQIDNIVTGRDAYDDDLKSDATTKDATWVLRQSYTFNPGGNRPVNQANLLAPTKVEDGVWSGPFLAVAVAAAPFPVPIKFEGTFRLIPIGRAARPWWARIGDFFAGCGRR